MLLTLDHQTIATTDATHQHKWMNEWQARPARIVMMMEVVLVTNLTGWKREDREATMIVFRLQ